MNSLKIGLVINPLAGLGGSVALKGSDGVADKALSLGATPKAQDRVRQALTLLEPYKNFLTFFSPAGLMGGDILTELGFTWRGIDFSRQNQILQLGDSTSEDTKEVVSKLELLDIDLLLFAGGDGTARDICSVIETRIPVLGIPSGVKIHSAVYAINPRAAGALIEEMIKGELIGVRTADVRDIDEEAFREGVVKARLFGEMLVPEEGRFVQMMKCGGIEKEEWVLNDIAAEIVETMEDDVLYIIGSGATTQAILDQLGLDSTLLGVDLVCNQELLAADVSEKALLGFLEQYPNRKLIISVIGGQGHIFGRGNQQLSPAVLRAIGKNNIQVIATKTKIKSLEGRPMLADTGDLALDQALCGWYKVISGYQDEIMYPVSDGFEEPRQ